VEAPNILGIAHNAIGIICDVTSAQTEDDYSHALNKAQDLFGTGHKRELADVRKPFLAAARAGDLAAEGLKRFESLEDALWKLFHAARHLPTRRAGGIDRNIVKVNETWRMKDGRPWVNWDGPAYLDFQSKMGDAYIAAKSVASLARDLDWRAVRTTKKPGGREPDELHTVEKIILQALKKGEPMDQLAIARSSKGAYQRSTIARWTAPLQRKGLIEKTGGSMYRLTEKGKAAKL
jgi:hypothetical protein